MEPNPAPPPPQPPTTTPLPTSTLSTTPNSNQPSPKTPPNKLKYVFIILIFLALLAIVTSYFIFLKPRMELQKGRTPDTSLKTKSIIKRTKIVESGYNSKLTIAPSNNDIVSGKVTITVEKVPENTKHVGFALVQDVNNISGGKGPNLGFDSHGADGWTMTLDTTEHNNGEYLIAIFAFETDASSNPIGTTNTKVEIKN